MLVAAKEISKEYGDTTVLSEVNLLIEATDRIGLVGRNGAGKSTLLRILTGNLQPDSGEFVVARGVRVRTLQQERDLQGGTIDSVLEAAFSDLDELEKELGEAAAAMSDGSEDSIARHEALLEHFARRGGYERRSRKEQVLLAFGFRGREHEEVTSLSGGEKTRLLLAALLVEYPDVLLLDEPTNHLDIAMVEWLEGFLGRYKGAVLVVSHDRTFLDNVTRETAYLRGGSLQMYKGNYSAFREQLELEEEQQAARYATESKQIAALQKSADRMKIWGLGMSKLARRARAMQSRVDRMQARATAAPSSAERTARISFYAPESGEVVLDAKNITRRVEGRTLFQSVNVQLRRGERVALIGRNGAGKTTLLRALLGLDPSDDPKGRVLTGARVSVGYYDQALHGVEPTQTLYDVAREYTQKDPEAHDLLGTFLFPYEQHDKPTAILSGGERARLALLKLAQEDNNFLVMDEPTNHLDMEMVESLEVALEDFDGTLLMVSHDRAFIEGLADRIWLVEDGQFFEYLGWEEYKEKHPIFIQQEQEKATTQTATQPVTTPDTPDTPKKSGRVKGAWQLKKDIEALEEEIARLEAELEEASHHLSLPDADFAHWGTVADTASKALEAALLAWEEKSEQLQG